MKFVGPVKIDSADAASQTVTIKANAREVGAQSNATGDVTISLGGGSGTIGAVLTQLVKSFFANLARA